jgi:hypothetical protein
MLRFVTCCEAAGPTDIGYYVDADGPIPPRAGPVSELLPERKFEPTLGVCLPKPHTLFTSMPGAFGLLARKSDVAIS